MARVSREVFPPAFRDVLQRATREGKVSVVFDTAEDCTRERLRFYRFLAQTRAREGDPLGEAAAGCTLQLRSVGMEKTKRQLVVSAAQSGSGSMWEAGQAKAEEAGAEISLEEALRAAREQAKREFGGTD